MWKFEIYQDAAREWRWRLVAANGRTVGDSGEGYNSRSGAERAVENARSKVSEADVIYA